MNPLLSSVNFSTLTMPHQQTSGTASSRSIYDIPGFNAQQMLECRTENESMSMAVDTEGFSGTLSDCDGHSPATPATPAPQSMFGSATPASADHKSIVPTIQNVVSTVNLGCKLDLNKIAQHARNVEYNPKRFASAIMRMREPRTTAMIFSSGKLVCTGAKNERESRIAARKFSRILQKLGYQLKFIDFKIQNIVGNCDVQFTIGLKELQMAHSQFCNWEPELFPGLVYRMVKPRVVLLIFASGKVVLTGAKIRQDIYEAFDNIYPILKMFESKNNSSR